MNLEAFMGDKLGTLGTILGVQSPPPKTREPYNALCKANFSQFTSILGTLKDLYDQGGPGTQQAGTLD